jgi:hypothetical protein
MGKALWTGKRGAYVVFLRCSLPLSVALASLW